MSIGAPSREDEGRLLQGHQSHRWISKLSIRLSWVCVSTPESEMARESVRVVVSSGSQPQGTQSDSSDDPRLVLSDPERQGARRPGSDVQPVHPRLDQLLQPLL